MSKQSQFQKVLRQVKVLKSPKHRLATFGTSRIDYTLVTDVPGLPDRSKLRQGHVTAERPQIITAENLREKFIGFGEAGPEIAEKLTEFYGDALRGLEYQFRNEHELTRIELSPPDQLSKELIQDMERDDGRRKALIRGSETFWQLSIMKFIVEETLASFTGNIVELQERGFFSGDSRLMDNRRREISFLFRNANHDKQAVSVLGKKLKEYGLFDEYQDDFFKLLGRIS